MKSSSKRTSAAAKKTDLPEHLRSALAELLKAFEDAKNVGHNVWDFAVEIGVLRAKGLTTSDMRWLCCKEYVKHRREETPAKGGRGRTFGGENNLTFSARSCFVLTEAGAVAARALAPPKAASKRRRRIPHYNNQTGVWRLGRRIIKALKQPAHTQRCVLEHEQRLGWPEWAFDPLPPDPEIDPRRHLNNTLKNLNNQQNNLVRFFGDGTGRGIRWRLVSKSKRRSSGGS